MSTTVDNRVVSMKFDNKDFEKNVSTSLSTLDKLKQALDFKGASKGLSEVKSSVNGFDMNPLLSSVQTISDRFTTMGIIGTTALQNITNQVIQTGEQMLKSLTIEPITEGFQEYELKMGSVQNILNSGRDAEGNAVDLDTVMGKLEELNEYADKTIYSFSDMTASIGKFTNAGVDLDKAVAAIQGISNEAAVSGANANEASRAMYNFAQALSAGSVKLIDWKSIENANMATVEFKQALIDAAVEAGTLADNLDGTYTVLTENNAGGTMDDVISTTQNFNDSLQFQWMTTDVLIDTLGRYANAEDELGKKAFKAATEVKTFSQLMDTLKESVGSGWATTWEIVFGNFEESKQLWTDVNDVVGTFINNQAAARNEMLQGWKDLGGRVELIEALKNAFIGLKSIIDPVWDGLRTVIPAPTAESLYKLTVGFKELTAQFKLSDTATENLYYTFTGVGSVLHIVAHTIGTVFNTIKPLFSFVLSGSGGILSVLGTIGAWLTRNMTTIESIIDSGIVGFVGLIVAGLQLLIPILSAVASSIAGLAKATIFPELESGLSAFQTKFSEFIAYLQNEVSASLPQTKEKIEEFANSLKEWIVNLGPNLKEAFDEVVAVISDCIKLIGATFTGFDDVETSSLDNFVKNIQEKLKPLIVVFGVIGFIFSKLKDAIAFVYPYIVQYLPVIAEVLGDIVQRIAKYVSTMSASELMDWINTGAFATFALSFKKIAGTFGGVGEMFEAATKAFKNLGDVLKAYQKDLKANILIKIATAIAILSVSMIALSKVSPEDLAKSGAAIGGLLTALVGSLALIMKSLGGGEIKGVGDAVESFADIQMIKALGEFMLALSGAVGIMTTCILALSEIGGDQLKTAMIGIAGIEALLGAIAVLITKLPKNEVSLLGLSTALLMIALSVKKMAEAIIELIPPLEILGKMDRDALMQGGIALAGILVALSAAMALTSKAGFGSAVGLGAMMLTIKEMASTVEFFGDMDTAKLKKGTIALETIIATLALLAGVMGKTKFGTDEGIGLALMAVSLEVVVNVMNRFAEMDIGTIAKGLGVMAGVLIEFAAAMIVMDGAKVGAAALVLMAVAIRMLVPALEGLGQLSLGEIVKGLIALAGVFAVLAGATAIFSVLAPGMLLLSVALAALGAGLVLFSVALGMVAAIDIAAIIALLPALGVAIMEFCKMVETVTPTVTEMLGVIIDEVCKLIQEKAPDVLDTIFLVIETFFVQLAEHAPGIVESLFQILLTILEALKNHIREITADLIVIAIEFILGVLQGVIDGMARIIQKIFELITAIIEGVATALESEENADRLRTAIINLGKSIIEFFKNFFGIHSPSTVFQELGWNLIEGLIAGIGDMIAAAGEKIRELGEHLLEKIREKLDAFRQKGTEIMDNVKSGIDNAKESVKTAFNNIIDALKNVDDKVRGFVDSGKNLILGFKKGIEDGTIRDQLMASVGTVFGAVRDRIAGIFQENSPSKVTFGFGRYVVEGFANGMRAYADMALDAADEFGLGTLDGIQSAVSKIADLVENGIDTDPTIRPVMDLSGVNSGIRDLNSMMNSSTSMDLAASANFDMNRMVSRNQNGVVVNNGDVIKAITNLKDNLADVFNGSDDGLNVNNSDVIGAISDLKDKISEMNSMLQGLNIVLDTGTLVGELSQPMDRAFGRMATLNERGVS